MEGSVKEDLNRPLEHSGLCSESAGKASVLNRDIVTRSSFHYCLNQGDRG